MAVEKKLLKKSLNNLQVKMFLFKELERAGVSHIEIQKTPIATRISIAVRRPAVVVGRRGRSIKDLCDLLERNYGIENPQIEVVQVEKPELDAKIMAEKIAQCVSQQGIANPEIFGNQENPKAADLKALCHLNFNSEFSGIQYYAKAVFYDFKSFSENPQNPISSVSAGNANLKADCELQKTEDFEKISKCSESRIYALDGKNNPYIIKILSVVRKTEKNARQ